FLIEVRPARSRGGGSLSALRQDDAVGHGGRGRGSARRRWNDLHARWRTASIRPAGGAWLRPLRQSMVRGERLRCHPFSGIYPSLISARHGGLAPERDTAIAAARVARTRAASTRSRDSSQTDFLSSSPASCSEANMPALKV